MKLQMQYIPVSDIAPHPDNPRRDLGDLTELSDSIRAKGVMENLVVIPNPDNFQRVALPGGGSAERWKDETEPKWTVVIGHRRLAAAKRAGLDVVPCVIQEMTRDEAIAAMLAENIQRQSLTPYEEAMGFRQLSLDLGKSVKEIRDMTGFGETTIRNRLKIAELDGGKARAALERGASLYDFAELEKIESPRLKNEVLEQAGTPNFRNELKSAIEREKRQAILDRLAAEAGAFAALVENPDHKTMEVVRSYTPFLNKKEQSVERPADAGETAYYYALHYPYLSLYRQKTERSDAEQAAKAAAEQARRERECALADMKERHFALRKEFVAKRGVERPLYPLVMRYAADAIIGNVHSGYGEFNLSLLVELLGLNERTDEDNDTWESVKETVLREKEARLLLCAAYARTDSRGNGYYKLVWNQATKETEAKYSENPGLDRLYDFLTDLGYQMSDEETQMQKGTHPLLRGADDETEAQ